LATLNETENILDLYEQIRSDHKQSAILVIDDSSDDGTLEKLNKIAEQDKNFTLIVRRQRLGLGSAHFLAFQTALLRDFDYLVTLDADFSHNPRYIENLLAESKRFNYIVGTRSKGGGSAYGVLRKFVSKSANLVCRILIPTSLSEYTNSLRLYDKVALSILVNNPPKDGSYSFFIEVTEILFQNKLRLGEIPTYFDNRRHGSSKIPKTQILKTILTIIRLLVNRLRPN